MCGILGIYGTPITENNTEKFRYALSMLKHRGPDNSQIWHKDKVILGHTRLSIIDLSKSANQPLSDISSRYWIVLNGEIYNYLEIKLELIRHGSNFRTHSDTEVVLEAYKYWGSDCLNHFNGMWAFAIYDSIKGILFLSRDRYGVKPLYYSIQKDNEISFASEMKAILALGINSKPNWEQIGRYLQGWGCDADNDTVFKNIHAIPPGHFMEITPEGYRLTKWWDILKNRVEIPKRFENRVEYFQELFEDAVRLRLRNDVDTGVCLSGGMDSSAVYGAAQKLKRTNNIKSATLGSDKAFRVFSVSYPGSPIDEYPWVEKCLDFWDNKEQTSIIYPKPEMFTEMIDDVIWHQEAPVWSSSVFAFHILYRHIASLGTKVILEGHGSDEMLGGYPYMVEAAIQSFAASRKFKLTWDSSNCLADTRNPSMEEYGPNAWRIFANSFPLTQNMLKLTPSNIKRYLKLVIEGNKLKIPQHSYTGYINPEIRNASLPMMTHQIDSFGKLDLELYAAFTERILPIVLRVFDRATMAYGIETRAPFMDYRVVQYIFSLREEDKVARETKHILRVASKEWAPKEVIGRKAKVGFAVAEQDWFNSKVVSDYLADIFHSSDAMNSSLFDGKTLVNDLDKCIRTGFSWRDTTRFWEVLNIFLWHKRFVETNHSEVI